MSLKIKAYASYFVSFLINNLDDFSNLRAIILFGSSARGDADKDSDVDIFIDIKKSNKNEEKKINKILEDFYKSREALLFKTQGIDNKINLIVGRLDEWKELKESIDSKGFFFYGPYISGKTSGKKHAIIYWDEIGENRGAFLNKIYGFKVKGKRYKGFLEINNGKRLGKSCAIIPIENLNELEKILRYYKVNAKIVEVYVWVVKINLAF